MHKSGERRRETIKTKKEKADELTRRWDKRAREILHHPKVQLPRAGKGHEGFQSRTVASSLPARQTPWAAALEESEGEKATLISEKYIACDDDGTVLAAYYPNYLLDWIASKVFKALLNFTGAYPPPTPSERDLRHTDWESLCELCGGKKSVGLYHLCTWFEQGHLNEDPCLSADARPGAARTLEALQKFVKSLQFLTFCLSLLYRVLNPNSWAKSIQVVSNTCKRNYSSKYVRSGKWDAWTGRAILANMPTHAHRDVQDWPHGLAAIACFGSFIGGEFVIPGLGVKFPFQPGDVIFINSRLCQHFVTEWRPSDFPDGIKGGRYSVVHFNHENIVKWALSSGP